MIDPTFTTPHITVYTGQAMETLIEMPDSSVDCVVTSPPYWGLRDYGMAGQIGLEETPGEYVGTLVLLFREVRRVLKDTGTLWLNLGDSYCSTDKWGGGGGNTGKQTVAEDGSVPSWAVRRRRQPYGLKPKDLVGIPWRVALALQADGWWLRSDIVWAKPNPMPEAVTDRPTGAHEYIFLLTKSARYFFNQEAVREPNSSPEQYEHNVKYAKPYAVYDERAAETGQPGNVNNVGIHSRPGGLGRNIRSVWEIANQPYPDAHFATFPRELPERCIKAGCPEDGVVLDPFAGSGTTLAVARDLGRKSIGIELNPAYVGLIEKRCAQLALDLPTESTQVWSLNQHLSHVYFQEGEPDEGRCMTCGVEKAE